VSADPNHSAVNERVPTLHRGEPSNGERLRQLRPPYACWVTIRSGNARPKQLPCKEHKWARDDVGCLRLPTSASAGVLESFLFTLLAISALQLHKQWRHSLADCWPAHPEPASCELSTSNPPRHAWPLHGCGNAPPRGSPV
jgi:hypothetical protein